MSSVLLPSIDTDYVLDTNPLRLERDWSQDRHQGEPYKVLLNFGGLEGELAGFTRIKYYAKEKIAVYPTILPIYRGLGLGVALYVAIEGQVSDHGYDPVLQADILYMSDAAEGVWRSLVRRGLATGERKYSNPFKFIRG